MATEPTKHGSLKQRALHELKIYWVITLYLWVFLGSFTIYRRLILKEFGVDYLNYGFALIEAMIIAKVILVGRAFGLGKRFEQGPLILSVLHKSILFGLFVLLFGILERLVEGWYHGKPWAEIVHHTFGLGVHEFLARIIMLIVSFVPFFAFWELGRALGPDRLVALFFSKQPPGPSSDSHN